MLLRKDFKIAVSLQSNLFWSGSSLNIEKNSGVVLTKMQSTLDCTVLLDVREERENSELV